MGMATDTMLSNSNELTSRAPRMLIRSDLSLRDLSPLLENRPQRSAFYYAWYTIIGVAVLLDFLAKIVADWFRQEEIVMEDRSLNPFLFGLRTKRVQMISQGNPDSIAKTVLRFLDKHSVFIAIVFNLLWFIDAFVKARQMRNAKLAEIDKKRLLDTFSEEDGVKDFKGAWGVYQHTIIVQCLSLPISFYILLHHFVSSKHTASTILMDEDEQITLHRQNSEVSEVVNINVSQATIFVILQYIGVAFVSVTGFNIHAYLEHHRRLLHQHIAMLAVKNPKRLYRRVLLTIQAIRWIKFLIPLIGTSNKLRGNTLDMWTKYQQRLHAKKVNRVRKFLWTDPLGNVPREQLEWRAAVIIQRNYRRRQAERTFYVLRLWRCNRQELAVLKIQNCLLRALSRARAKIHRKQKELIQLQKKNHQWKVTRAKMSMFERRRMYELQDELQVQVDRLVNKKLLLRPNTQFAVMWKILFVLCILVDMLQLTFASHLRQYIDEKTGCQMSLPQILEHYFIPLPSVQRQECSSKYAIKNHSRYKNQDWVSRWWIKLHDFVQHMLSILKGEPKTIMIPWYCHNPYGLLINLYSQGLKLAVHLCFHFLAFVSYMDVFVTFFTGELDTESGVLMPKPFFSRWILPGIALQLLVNPQMKAVQQQVWRIVIFAQTVGPIRVYRWSAAFFYPVLYYCFCRSFERLWNIVVINCNQYPIAKRINSWPKIK